LLGGGKVHLDKTDTDAFASFLSGCASDCAVRAFIVTFVPSESVLQDFISSEIYVPDSDAAEQIIAFITDSMKRHLWRPNRAFLNIVGYPMMNAGTSIEEEPDWQTESAWLEAALSRKAAVLTWHELEDCCMDGPAICWYTIMKCTAAAGKYKHLSVIPQEFLQFSFELFQSGKRIRGCHFQF
jgi:hypothetical protein